MLGNPHIDLHYTFHATGKTPALNVLHDRFRRGPQGTEREMVKALFLGNGDPRNLLYSLYCESGYGENIDWDFTCCDLDPAVLARNVFLFALIIDKVPLASLWNVFYHFYVKDCDLGMINYHAKVLVRSSESMEIWSSSKVGKIIGILSQDTLTQLRSFWLRYINATDLNEREMKVWEIAFRQGAKAARYGAIDRPLYLDAFRSGGVHFGRALPVLAACLQAYWETGVVGGNADDRADLGLGGHGRVNPLFAVSSAVDGAFSVHPDSDPLLGFHLATCFDDESFAEGELAQKVVKRAKEQFRNWCKCFRSHVVTKTVHVNIFCGDALRFCYELQALRAPNPQINKLLRGYTAQWKSSLTELRGLDRPQDSKLFDAIDTSNLADYIGMLNVLPAVTPLLSRNVTSTLFTDTVRRSTQDLKNLLSNALGTDVTTLSIILGLAPLAHLISFTTDGSAVEAARTLTSPTLDGEIPVSYHRIAWKIPQIGDAPCSETYPYHPEYTPKDLCEVYYKLYLSMFAEQSTDKATRSSVRTIVSPMSLGLEPYTPQSFVCFLHLLQQSGYVHWLTTLDLIVKTINNDVQIRAGSKTFQEQEVWFYLYDFTRDGNLHTPPRAMSYLPLGALRPQSAETGILGREDLPSIVFATMIVPREKLIVFTRQTPRAAGTPGIHLRMTNLPLGLWEHYFSLQCFFGKLTNLKDDICDVVPDAKGWKGDADLIVTCAVPTWTLLVGERNDLTASLCITPSSSSAHYSLIVGSELAIFSCGLDSSRLQILRQPPGMKFDPKSILDANPPTTPTYDRVCLSLLDEKMKTQLHTSIPGLKNEGMEAPMKEITVSQISPCVVRVRIEGSEPTEIGLPFPVDIASHHVNYLQTAGVDLAIMAAPALQRGGYDFNPFPVCMQGTRTTTPTIPHVKLDKLPILRMGKSTKATWIDQLLAWALSASEHKLGQDDASPDETPALMELKASVCTIFEMFFSTGGEMRVFDIGRRYGHHIFLFISNIRHSDFQGSVVLDAYVVPFAMDRIDALGLELIVTEFAESGDVLNLVLGPKEESYWKKLLPALVECCRTSWSHKDTCEYRVQGHIPLSAEKSYNDVCICTCGEGQEIEHFPRHSEWGHFAKYATRIAIPPISMVPFLEAVLKREDQAQLQQEIRNMAGTSANEPAKPKSEKCDHCGKKSEATLRRCQRCSKTKYCNHTCSKAAWKGHKKTCKKG
ncbi:hypothetical protein FQN54_004630 [Arachnomyces sp. PD_36]|nr:hypothetical protein FQN54_004630 [Arachnomyces sp. PD_36]